MKMTKKDLKLLQKLVEKYDENGITNYYGSYKKDKKYTKKVLKKQLRRDAIDLKIITDLLAYLPDKTFTDKRAIICVVLLFITGCRMNELRNFNKLTINNLLQDGTLIVHTFKTRNTRRIDISEFEKEFLKSYYHVIEDYYKIIDDNKHVLYSSSGKELAERTAYHWLNTILRKYGQEKGIKLLSHSFRIGYISEILRYYNVQVAKSIVGHANINTTIRYDRNILNSEDVKKMRNNMKSHITSLYKGNINSINIFNYIIKN